MTFVDLPIRRKFLIFSGGVLFWFVLMFLITIAALVNVNDQSGIIVNTLMREDRIAQKMVKDLQTLNVDVAELVKAEDVASVMRMIEISKARLEAVNSLLSTINPGASAEDHSPGTGKPVAISATAPAVERLVGEDYVKNYVEQMSPLLAGVTRQFGELAQLKLAQRIAPHKENASLEQELRELQQSISRSIAASNGLSGTVETLIATAAHEIKTVIAYAVVAAVCTLLLAAVLQVLFTRWIANSIANPVSSIIDQIHALGKGEAELGNKISITSKDDIGTLSAEFNGLMESIHKMTMFKKVIEEDDSLEDVYSRLGKIFQEVGIGEYMIYEVPIGQNKLKPVYPLVMSNEEISCDADILDNCDLCKAKKTGHMISSIAYPQMCKMFLPQQEKEHVCIPMIVGGNAGGVVQFVFDKPGPDGVRAIQRKVFEASQYVKESQSVIEAKRLMSTVRESALNDALTGLKNRRFLQEYTENLVAGALRRGKSTGLIMCDLDYFKQVNDTHGHSAGDEILKETANIIKKSIRDADILIRFGGEEFLAVLLDIKEGGSVAIAEKIRQNMEQAKFKVKDGILRKTISLGISEFPLDTNLFWQAIKFADVALYKAKEGGRNKAVRFTKDMWVDERF